MDGFSRSKSSSEASRMGDEVRHGVRGYVTTRRYYSQIGDSNDEVQQRRRDGRGGAEGGFSPSRSRLVVALGVCVSFAAVVSISCRFSTGVESNATDWRQPMQSTVGGDYSYGGKLESFNQEEEQQHEEERVSTGVSVRGTGMSGERGEEGGGVQVGTDAGTISLVATNEYGEFDRKALAMYGLEMVVEPFRETRITVTNLPGASSMRFHWLLIRAEDSSGTPLEGAEPVVDGVGGSFATVTLTEPGETYVLWVRRIGLDGSVLKASGGEEEGARKTIACKYVRRELRDLTEADRNGYFSAMREFYTVEWEEGRAKYGKRFSNAQHVASYHNSRDYCYHNGMQFLNAHTSFNLWVEQNLQRIDPKVSLALWDFMLDASLLGTGWGASEIFGPDMFGSALGSPENHFQISDGWFAGIRSIYDPLGDFTATAVKGNSHISTNHNPYGFVDSSFNYQKYSGVIRTNSYCGLESASEFSKCEVFIDCFESHRNLRDWTFCMEHAVHASIHGMIGGGFDCNANMFDFHQENPRFSAGLLTFVLEYLLANKWPSNSLMEDYNDCDTECGIDQTEPCGCTCLTDPFAWTDQEVYEFMESSLETLQTRSHGDEFIDDDEGAEFPLGFMQDGVRLDDDSSFLLMRKFMMIACEPGKVGAMSTGASPLDPIFWVLHAVFEKASHVLQLSPGYRDSYDFAWDDLDCGGGVSGGNLTDALPFTEKMLGLGEGSELLTNAELSELLHTSNPKVPYLYEGFGEWGTCTDWDPCPECSAAVSSRGR